MDSDKELSAKEIFIKYNCSSFCMMRENPPLYDYYKSLHISKKEEIIWRKEQLKEYYLQLMKNESKSDIWKVVDNMYYLVENLRDKESIFLIKSAIESLLDDLDKENQLLIAETIVGRTNNSARQGLIFLSYDIGEKITAMDFSIIALNLLNGASEQDNYKERVIYNKNKCFDIIKKLKLKWKS